MEYDIIAMRDREFKSAMYENLARVGKAISSGRRIELLDLLSQGPRTVESLASEVDQTISNTSQHLQVLRRANLVQTERNGTYITYALADDQIGDFIRGLRVMGMSRLAEMQVTMERFFGARTNLVSLDGRELPGLMQKGNVTLIDVRPSAEYRAGHLAGAVSLPLLELEARMAELPKDQDIAVYCRGPFCVMAIDAVEILVRSGFRAFHVTEGITDFRALNLAIEKEREPA